jgi:hypothetical protein
MEDFITELSLSTRKICFYYTTRTFSIEKLNYHFFYIQILSKKEKIENEKFSGFDLEKLFGFLNE